MFNQQLRFNLSLGKELIIENIDFSKIYQSNTNGPFKIIEDLGRDARSRRYVKIKFMNTGFEKIVRYDIAMDGKVRDELYGIDFSKTYYSRSYGPFKIISYLGRDEESKKVVRIKFINTGYEYDTLLKNVNNGMVKDYSVNYDDRKFEVPLSEYDNYINIILSSRWKGMMARCYNENCESYPEYGLIGVTVCDEWKDLNNFLNTIRTVKNFDKFYNDPLYYHLDKDFLQKDIPKNLRIYSPNTCIFLHVQDNSNLAFKEKYDLIENGYYGIHINKLGYYTVSFRVDHYHTITVGTYSNLIAALNEYNFFYILYGKYKQVPLLNNVPFMSHQEALKYLIPEYKNIMTN